MFQAVEDHASSQLQEPFQWSSLPSFTKLKSLDHWKPCQVAWKAENSNQPSSSSRRTPPACCPLKAKVGRARQTKTTASTVRQRPKPTVPTEHADVETQSSDEERQSSSEADFEVEEMFEDIKPLIASDAVFMPAQITAIQETVSTSVNEALRALNNRDAPSSFSDNLRTPSPRIPNTATPLGLHHHLDKSLKDKILRGEYIDFSLLLPD